ncbi:MAG TPA: sulfurtransferase TusA family protein [Candidatus Korarchaeota archaeon]|nr:sulfurtransferase TusA family protein [Candidatus Korarchaeota archaeon]
MTKRAVNRVDLRGRKSPLPVVNVAKLVKKMEAGKSLEVLIDDLRSVEDIHRWADRTGHRITLSKNEGGYWRIVIRKKG